MVLLFDYLVSPQKAHVLGLVLQRCGTLLEEEVSRSRPLGCLFLAPSCFVFCFLFANK
jgi:hypothetical protein